jgi:O-antigen ligase/Tfp pilus assembly protein PilF
MKKNKQKSAKTEVVNEHNPSFRLFAVSVLIILPLVYFSAVQDPSLMPRMLWLTAWLLGWSVYLFTGNRKPLPEPRFLKSSVVIFGGLYLVWMMVTMIFSGNPSEGLSDVLKTGLTLLVILFSAQLFAENRNWFHQLSRMALIALFLALLIGFYQYLAALKPVSLSQGSQDAVIRIVHGLTGNKNEYSGFLMLLLPFAAWQAFYGKGIVRTFALVALFLSLVMIILLTTRAVWLGLLVAAGFISLMIIFSPDKFGVQKQRARRLGWVLATVVFLVGAGAIEGGKYSDISYLKKLGSIIRPSEDNNHFRLKIWKITGEMAIDHPVAGVGPGNWQIEIPEYYPRIGLKGKEVNWIAPHNDFLWILAEKGFIGLAFYLGMVISFFMMFAKLMKVPEEKEKKVQALLIAGGFIGYLVVACFDFSYQRVEQQVMFALFMAAMLAWTECGASGKNVQVKRLPLLLPAMMFLIVGLFYSIIVVKSQYHVKSALASMKSGDYEKAKEAIGKSHTSLKEIDALGSPVYYYEGLIEDQLGNKPAALAAYSAALEVHPNHLAVLNNLGRSYFEAGYYGLAEYYYLRALKIVPGYMETRVNLSTLYYKKGEYQRSLEQLKEIRGVRKPPAIKQNMRILREMTGTAADTLAKYEKMKKKALKKEEKRKSGKKRPKGHE